MTSRALTAALAFTALMAASSAASAQAYKAPRNAFGQPDLSGVWTNATITPLTRPSKFGDRAVLTPEEARAQEQATADQVARADAPTDPNLKVTDLKNANCGADGISGFNCGYNQGWKDPGEKVVDLNGEKRTSIIISPKNGQFPATKTGAPARRGARSPGGSLDGPEARGAGERCLVGFGGTAGPPMLPVMYNNNYQIQQSKDAVVILVEMVHDARIVRLNAKHDPNNLKRWLGDSIGRWEGDTLVVETINIHPDQGMRGGGVNPKVTEWFTRISPDKIKYRFQIDDPQQYAEPIVGEMALNTSKGLVYEYACHEGNYAMEGILAGARLAEKEGRKASDDGQREEGFQLMRALAIAAALALAAGPAFGQAGYKAPRNNFGQPDLAGVWSNATITRLERDPKYGDRVVLTPDEVREIEGASDARNDRLRAPTDQTKKVDDLPECQSGAQGAACGYNAFWTDPGTRLVRIGDEPRASILVEPKNGRLPLRREALARQRGRLGNDRVGNFDGPERRSLGERCIVGFGGTSGPPMLPVLYNNHYQIQQTKDAVVIVVEMVHDARVIRLNDKHGPAGKPVWMGDSVGRWEGETLVVESANFRPDNTFRGATEKMKVIERFTRISPKQILYQFEVIDPDTFSAPVKGEQALNAIPGQVYEYACHEGNYGLTGILAGAREAEKAGKEVEGNRGEIREEGGD